MTKADDRSSSLARFITASHWSTMDMLYAMQIPHRTIACPLCQHSGPRTAYTTHTSTCQFAGGQLERYQCPDCDFTFGPLKMLDTSDELLAADYELLYEQYREFDNTEAELRAFHECRPVAAGAYLNWGSGAWSGSIDALRAEGWDVWGFEPHAQPESPFVAGVLADISAKFDGIFSNNVIEHFRDPVTEFTTMASYLKPGGRMVHATACYQLRYENTRFHTGFFLGRSVEVLAQKIGLKVVDRTKGPGEYESVTFLRP